jgi:endonuclease YncB( thermonuclease family)
MGGGVKSRSILGLVLLVALVAAWVTAYRTQPSAHAAPSAVPDSSAILPGTITKVTDGDGISVQLQSGPMEVRLFGADAPERAQDFYQPATKLMRSLVERKNVELEPVRQDRYGRMVARVFVGEADVGAAMIEKGYAWAYRDYLWQVDGADRYCDLESQARADRRGLWAVPPERWEPPWVVRARKRGEHVPPRNYSNETATDCRAAIRHRAGSSPREKPRELLPPNRPDCRIKGNINSKGERIYHVPGSSGYPSTEIDPTRGERWFCTEDEARAAGWRAPR